MELILAFAPSFIIGALILDRHLTSQRLRASERAYFVKGFRLGVAACNQAQMAKAKASIKWPL